MNWSIRSIAINTSFSVTSWLHFNLANASEILIIDSNYRVDIYKPAKKYLLAYLISIYLLTIN